MQKTIIDNSQNQTSPFLFPIEIELKKKKKKRCCEKFKRKGKYCGSCPLKGCA